MSDSEGNIQKPFAPKSKALNCPNCGASMSLKASGRSLSIVCASCGSILDVADENFPKIISKLNDSPDFVTPLIPLGQRGKLKGHLWEVIGFLERKDPAYDYIWYEYLLFNPYQGYRWLTEAQGHWNYVLMSKDKPHLQTNSITNKVTSRYLGKEYSLFNKGEAVVSFALGEFYLRIKVGDKVECEDYISPPYMLSCEKDDSEETWSLGEYIEPSEIEEAFKLDFSLPPKSGISPNQPSQYTSDLSRLTKAWVLAVACICVLQFLHITTSMNQTVYQNTHSFSSNQPVQNNFWSFSNNAQPKKEEEIVTPTFEVKGKSANMAVRLEAPVDNSWFFVDGELVNENTGQSAPFNRTVQYYYGHDSDGSWSEGSKSTNVIFSSLPAGKYHLNLEPSADSPSIRQFTIEVRRGTPLWANFFLAFFLLSFPMLVYWFRAHSFEVNRWSTSDYSPYQSDDE